MSITPFRGREEAGRLLGQALAARWAETVPPVRPLIVFGVARGGVPVAAQVAPSLHASLDVAVVRKVGAPGNPELGLGAVDARRRGVLDSVRARRLGVSDEAMAESVRVAVDEAGALEGELRGDRPPPDVEGCAVLAIDDGVATGGTLAACCLVLREAGAAWVGAAAPVASPEAGRVVGQAADRFDCLAQPLGFAAVGEYYIDFHQVSSAEVRSILDEQWSGASS